MIQSIEYQKLASFLDLTLENATGKFIEKRVLDFIFHQKKDDLFKYLFMSREQIKVGSRKVKIIRRWLENPNIIDECCHVLLAMPIEMATKMARVLNSFQPKLMNTLTQHAYQSSPTECLKVLDILSDLTNSGNLLKPPLFRLLMERGNDSKIRSKLALVMGKFSNNPLFFKHLLRDSDSRVRANILEVTGELSNASIRKVVMPYLKDESNRVQANAAKVIYERGHQRGITTLIEMLDLPNSMKCASAAWVLGEVREISTQKRLKELLCSPEEKVAFHAKNALEIMDHFVQQLDSQLAQFAKQLTYFNKDGDQFNPIRQTLTFFANQPKEKVAEVIPSLGVPKFVEFQMSRWILPLDKKGMMLVALLAFLEKKEIREFAHALLIPMQFQQYVKKCVDTLKASDQKSKMSVLEQLARASKWIQTAFPEISEEMLIIQVNEEGERIRTISANELEEGMILTRDLYTADNTFLLSKNTIITKKLLAHMSRYLFAEPIYMRRRERWTC